MQTVFFASRNKAKIENIKLYFEDKYLIKTPYDYPHLDVHVDEGVTSLEDNALLKAFAYAKKVNLITLADDTGFFINELDGQPGVAAKRWAGELPDDATEEMFWHYLQKKTAHLTNITCYFNQCFAVTTPLGEHVFVSKKTHGSLDKEKLSLPFNQSDYPLAQAFHTTNRPLCWDDMTPDMKKDFNKDLIQNLDNAISSLLSTLKKELPPHL